jgi:hypothetical protein
MAREAAVTYEARSIAEVFWLAFKSLPEEDQGAFLRKLLDDPFWYEEITDAMAMIEAQGEPTRPFREVEEELKREGLL